MDASVQATLSGRPASQFRVVFRRGSPPSLFVHLPFHCGGSRFRFGSRTVPGQFQLGASDLLRVLHCAGRKGTGVATLIGRTLFIAIALLVVTVGALATQSRLPNAGQNTSSWHTSKLGRMEACASQEEAPAPPLVFQPAVHSPTAEPEFHPAPMESPLAELAGVPRAHGLRAPPRL